MCSTTWGTTCSAVHVSVLHNLQGYSIKNKATAVTGATQKYELEDQQLGSYVVMPGGVETAFKVWCSLQTWWTFVSHMPGMAILAKRQTLLRPPLWILMFVETVKTIGEVQIHLGRHSTSSQSLHLYESQRLVPNFEERVARSLKSICVHFAPGCSVVYINAHKNAIR